MEHLSGLLFELANVDRLEIMLELSNEPMKLTNISKKLDLTVQETSRHLQRLSDAKLTEKKTDGAYQLTLHGANVLQLLPGLDFLVEHSDYFLNHKIDHIAKEFVVRIGELSGSKLLDNPVIAFQKVNSIIEGAKEHLWFVADEVPSGSIPLIEAAVKRQVSTFYLMPKDMVRPNLPEAYRPKYDSDDRKRLLTGWAESVDIVSVISEKEAVVGFPTVDGKMDYLAFSTSSDSALNWCKDLFMHYWNQVEPVHPPEE